MGFGLFVPDFKQAFSLSTPMVGFVSSLGFVGFFIGLILAQVLLLRSGPKLPILSGLIAALTGLTCVAMAQSPIWLALGVFLAASSAGFAWTPFNDPVHRKIQDRDRPMALSAISTGTSAGIAVAGLAALGTVYMDLHWRACWAAFAVASAAALAINWVTLREIDKAPAQNNILDWRSLLHPEARPLFVIAFVFGITSGVYLAFAADHFFADGGLAKVPDASIPGLVYLFLGLFGLSGLMTGHAKQVIGLAWLLRALMMAGAASLALVALAPGHWMGLIVSAGAQGVHVMMTSAVLAVWSERLFPTLPALSFTSALLAVAAGNVLGPVSAGLLSDAYSPEVMLLATAALPAVTALLLRNAQAAERPARDRMQPAAS